MKIFTQHDAVAVFDLRAIAAAVSKASLHDAEDEINQRIDILDCVYGYSTTCSDAVYQEVCNRVLLEYQRLLSAREGLKLLLRIKNQQIRAMIKEAWSSRDRTTGRCSTNTVADLMLMSIPTPPTFKTAKCSFGCGGAIRACKA